MLILVGAVFSNLTGKSYPNKSSSLFNLAGCNRENRFLDVVILVFTSVFLAE
jgi:hypothetical protein